MIKKFEQFTGMPHHDIHDENVNYVCFSHEGHFDEYLEDDPDFNGYAGCEIYKTTLPVPDEHDDPSEIAQFEDAVTSSQPCGHCDVYYGEYGNDVCKNVTGVPKGKKVHIVYPPLGM